MASSNIKAYLNIYDLVKYNPYVHCLGLGAYHTGIEINGVEWSYGHTERGTGVYPCLPGSHPNATLRERIDLGDLDLTIHQVAECLERLRPPFAGFRYHLLYMNCNHFTAAFYHELTSRSAPSYINRLSAVARCCICCLPEYLQPRPGIDIVAKKRRGSTGTVASIVACIKAPFSVCFGANTVTSTTSTQQLEYLDGDANEDDDFECEVADVRLHVLQGRLSEGYDASSRRNLSEVELSPHERLISPSLDRTSTPPLHNERDMVKSISI
mmetsp:Transcript_7920/g.11231  ORF Transcript_7920/g.11231 Transcript_7920/m.11231 type:complete len:269 (-) Transcript_7920:393-1199(-)